MSYRPLITSLRPLKNAAPHSGFTLIELAVVILISGLILALAGAFALSIMETTRRLETQGKIDIITAALHEYAYTNKRLPCPANPAPVAGTLFGAERGSGAAGDILPENCTNDPANWSGMVPFRTLGLDPALTTDGYGNLFTYVLSPAFSQDTADDLMPVHAACRTKEWYYMISNDRITSAAGTRTKRYGHKSPRKARFCCPPLAPYNAATDLTVEDEAGNAALTDARSANNAQSNPFCPPTSGAEACSGSDCCSAGYSALTRPYSTAPNIQLSPDDQTTAIAYVLISHGANGANAAYSPATGTRPAPASGMSGHEIENADDDRTFRDLYEKSDQFDDLLYWRTQDLIMAAADDSCVYP